MKTTRITLRNIDPRLKKLIDQNADKRNKSINTYVVEIIEQSLGYKKGRRPGWKKFSGAIPGDGISQDTLDEFETIDKSTWQ